MLDDKELIDAALKVRENAYAPYSGFAVGAALLCAGGRVYVGCNIESASFSPTCCAERAAFFAAVSAGERAFEAIAVAGGAKHLGAGEMGYFYPCGVCRQVMAEFCQPETFRILTARSCTEYSSFVLGELLPHGFSPENLRL